MMQLIFYTLHNLKFMAIYVQEILYRIRSLMALVCDGANGVTVVTVVVVPVPVATVEVEVVGVVAVVLVQRAGPVVAVRATVVQLRAVAVARSGERAVTAIRDERQEGAVIMR